jgi:hypothetical protein
MRHGLRSATASSEYGAGARSVVDRAGPSPFAPMLPDCSIYRDPNIQYRNLLPPPGGCNSASFLVTDRLCSTLPRCPRIARLSIFYGAHYSPEPV